MSVQQIKGRIARTQGEFDNFNLSSNSLIYTTAEESRVENYSIEFSLGEGWNESYSLANKKLIKIEEKIKIPRHGSIVVEVKEEIRVPHNRYGIILATGSMFLSNGIILPSAKIEPSFHGKLKLRLFNTTNQSITVKKGEKLASAIFFPTEYTSVHDNTYRAGDISAPPPSIWTNIKKWFSKTKDNWISSLTTSLIVALISFSLVYFFYYRPSLNNQSQSGGQNAQKIAAPKPERGN